MAAHPQFDAITVAQEQVVIEFCQEIMERSPDPVRLLEMAEALYWAEVDPSRCQEVQRILGAVRKMTDRANMNFTIDPTKVIEFMKFRKDPTNG